MVTHRGLFGQGPLAPVFHNPGRALHESEAAGSQGAEQPEPSHERDASDTWQSDVAQEAMGIPLDP
jgi:hypothetical protein